MNNAQINKLTGQLRALEDTFAHLVCLLEMTNVIGSPQLTQQLNLFAERYRPATGDKHLVEQAMAAQETMQRIASMIDGARETRRLQADQ